MTVKLLKDSAAEKRAKEKAEAPTVKTEEQTRHDEEQKEKNAQKEYEDGMDGKGKLRANAGACVLHMMYQTCLKLLYGQHHDSISFPCILGCGSGCENHLAHYMKCVIFWRLVERKI